MDLRAFFQKIRQVEKDITGTHAIVVSNETSDGGRPGQVSEVARGVAARMIVEGRARLATPEESIGYHKDLAEAVELARRRDLIGKAHVQLLSDSDIEALRGALKPAKSS